MKVYEIGTGYTSIPARMGAATEIVVEGLTRAFQKQNVPVEIIDIKANNRPDTDLPIREVWVPGCFSGTDIKLGLMHKLKRVVYSVSLAFTLRRILKAAREEVILHFHNQYNLFFFLKLVPKSIRAKARIAYTVHSYIWPGQWEEIKETVRKRYFQEICCVQQADDVLVLNDKTAEHFVQRLQVCPENIHRIVNGVDTDVYRILPAEAAAQLYDNRKVILQVGSVCDRKNQLEAVKMLAPYLDAHKDVLYVYAGGIIDESYQEAITAYAQKAGIPDQVCYAGELAPGAELNRYYNAAAVTVFPSKVESFGLVILESLCAGTRVLMPQKPLFELETGYHIYHSPEEFAARIEKCLKETGCREDVRREAAAVYGWEAVAKDHLQIWQS